MDEVSKKFNSQQKVLRYGDKTYKIFKDGTMQSYTNPLRNLKSKNYFPFILRAKCYPVTKTVRNLKKKKKKDMNEYYKSCGIKKDDQL